MKSTVKFRGTFRSEVTRILEEIALDFQTVRNSLTEGTAQQTVVTETMACIEEKKVVLIGIVGSEKAGALIMQVLQSAEYHSVSD